VGERLTRTEAHGPGIDRGAPPLCPLRLSNVAGIATIEVERDACFSSLGLLFDPQPEMLAFVEHSRYLPLATRTPGVSCVITTPELAGTLDGIPGIATSREPRRAFYALHNHLATTTEFYWRSFPTEIDPTAQVHPRAFVAASDVRIGPGCVIEPNVTIMERSLLGDGVVVRAGAVLGANGFEVTRLGDGVLDLIHAGGIHVGDNVQILANAAIALAVFRQLTTIGRGSRIGNLTFLSHSVQVGPRCFIGHGCTVNGNARVGADVWIGPGSTIADRVRIGDEAQVSLGSTVITDVPAGQRVTGSVAIDHRSMLRHIVDLRRR
jgi:UDP-3-O-[3-hydroxymyristoyl] glucosamine N-acyltransferase